MEESFTVRKLMEIGFDTLSAVTGLFVVAMALRVASAFTLSAHRRAMRVLAAAVVVVVASEVVGIAAAFTQPSTLTDPSRSSRSLSPSQPRRPCCTTCTGWSGRRSHPSGTQQTWTD